jgi:hypothetical protein
VARPRKKTDGAQLTPGQASYVLERLISDRRVTRTEIGRYMSEMQNEIGFLERRLQALRDAAGSVAAAAGNVAAMVTAKRRGRPRAAVKADKAVAEIAGPARRRRSAAITAEQKASRQLQGRYLGLIRQIAASKRAQYQRIAKDRGRDAAIKEMLTALGK